MTCGTRSRASRSGAGVSIPELAEQMGHNLQMTVYTCTRVIRELRGLAAMPAEEQVMRDQEPGGRRSKVAS
jgi:hypothetical protein